MVQYVRDMGVKHRGPQPKPMRIRKTLDLIPTRSYTTLIAVEHYEYSAA